MASPLLHALLAAAVPLSAPTVDFTRDIAPVLAARCFQCHGPDASSRKAGLRLDKRDGALKGGKSGIAAIVPGKPEESELLARVMSTDADERMPPAEGHVALTAAEVDAMRAWIANGAPYAKHWSWEALPDGEARTDLLHASSTARTGASGVTGGDASIDHDSWLRRVHFDIVGLPPSPDAVRAFDADHSPAARERVVDALLASPRYGERWGRHWMDVMRYAETLGHEFDYSVDEAWRWRDWVIRAFNTDVPYPQFVREQVAGDLLSAPRMNPADGTNESVTATGWWWMTQGTHAPVDVRLDQAERVDNQIDVASKAFLGTTASCARCHDHKFDDVSQRDYYALFGVVKSSRRAYAYQDPHGIIGLAVKTLRLGEDTARTIARADGTDAAWERAAAQAKAAARPAPTGATWTFDRGTFEGWTASGWAFGESPVSCGDRIAPDGHAPVTVAGGWAHSGRLSDRLQGTLRSPTFTVPEIGIGVRCAGSKCRLRLVVDGYYLDDRNELLFENFTQCVDHPAEWRTHAWDAKRYAGEQAYIEVIDDGDGFIAVDWVSLGMVTGKDLEAAPFEGAGSGSGATPPSTPELDIPAPMRVLAMEDGTGMDSPLYVRGVARNAGDMVPRGMITALRSDTPGADGSATVIGSGRLQLAEELVSPRNPLTWRVMANRVWHHMTGRGIVPSTDDFGVLGQAPADKALLDELAMRLRAHGSVKELIREIALSPAYAAADRPLRRLDAEALRDAMIDVAGGLDLTMGGPSIPVHLTDAMQGRGRPGASGPLDGARRRSVYQEVRRNFLNPFMLVFDEPIPTTTVGARSVSNVPAQGLTLMNDPFVRGQAERWGAALAARTAEALALSSAPPAIATRSVTEDAVRAMYVAAYARPATADEVSNAVAFLGVSTDGANAVPDANVWSDLAHAILLSAEFRFLR
jgi:mono/diheme cytochrome c family protein